MNLYDREIALFNIQEMIVKKIKEIKPTSLKDVKEIMKPFFDDRNEILFGNKLIIEKYKLNNKKGELQ